MPLELDDPELVERLERAGVDSVHEPLVPFLADGSVDLDRVMALAVRAQSGGVRSTPLGHAAVVITELTYRMAPTRCEPYLERGVLGGFVPFSPKAWGLCRDGRLSVRTHDRFPDTVRDALPNRPLRQFVDPPAFAGRSYVIESCVEEGAMTVTTCRVELLSVDDAVRRALKERAAVAPSSALMGE